MDPHVILEFSRAAAAAVVAARLGFLRLIPTFRVLFLYLLFYSLYNFAYALMSPRSQAYFWVYVAVTPLECVLSVFAVRELVTLIFRNYPGIRTVGRWATYAGVALAVALSLVTVRLLNSSYRHKKLGLYYLQTADRWVVFSLALAIIVVLFVLSKYPLHLGRNTYASSGFFSAVFLSDAVRLAIDSLTPQFFNHYADWSEGVVITLCLVAWSVMLRPEPAPITRVAFPTPVEERLLHQLDALNQLMTRAARR